MIIPVTAKSSSETTEAIRHLNNIFKVLKGKKKTSQFRVPNTKKYIFFKNESDIRHIWVN